MVKAGSKGAEGLSKREMDKRRRAEKDKMQKLKNPLFFVSPTRLSIRNLATNRDTVQLKKQLHEAFLLAAKEVTEP